MSSGAIIVETERTRMRCWRRRDAELLRAHCNTSKVMKWLGGVQRKRDVAEDVAWFMRGQRVDGHSFWLLERRADDEFLGFCGLACVPDLESPSFGDVEIGWRLRADAWGQGYAFEAASACLNWGFWTLKAPVIVSRAAKGNHRSRRLMERLGMQRDRRLDYDPDDETDRLVGYTIDRSAVLASSDRHAERRVA